MSTFDPEAFMQTQVEGANSTSFLPVPDGDYTGIIEKVQAREINTKDGPGRVLDVTWNILDEDLLKSLDRSKLTVRQGIFLDMRDDGSLNMSEGQNVGLGQLREAVGQNNPRKAWSFSYLEGAGPCLCKVAQKADNTPGSDRIFNNVVRVAAIA